MKRRRRALLGQLSRLGYVTWNLHRQAWKEVRTSHRSARVVDYRIMRMARDAHAKTV
jgi:hypothetical protein